VKIILIPLGLFPSTRSKWTVFSPGIWPHELVWVGIFWQNGYSWEEIWVENGKGMYYRMKKSIGGPRTIESSRQQSVIWWRHLWVRRVLGWSSSIHHERTQCALCWRWRRQMVRAGNRGWDKKPERSKMGEKIYKGKEWECVKYTTALNPWAKTIRELARGLIILSSQVVDTTYGHWREWVRPYRDIFNPQIECKHSMRWIRRREGVWVGYRGVEIWKGDQTS